MDKYGKYRKPGACLEMLKQQKRRRGLWAFLCLDNDEMLIGAPGGEVRLAPHTGMLSHMHTQQNQRNLVVKLWNELIYIVV